MTSILETARQVVALEKRIGLKLDMAEHIEPDEYDGEEIDEANAVVLAYGSQIASALVEAEVYISRLLAICQRYGVANHTGIDMHSQELIDLRTYRNARAFLSRISKEQDNG